MSNDTKSITIESRVLKLGEKTKHMDYSGSYAINKDFEAFFQKYFNQAFSVAYRILLDRLDAEDAAQEAFIAMYRNWASVLKHPNQKAFLLRTTIHLSINRNLKAKRDRIKATRASEVPQYNAEEALQVESRLKVRKALRKLKPKHQACLILKSTGYSYFEISKIMGLRISSISNTISRAEKKFKQFYEEF